MRVTQSMILRSTLQRVNDNRDEMNDIQRRIATKKKVEKASDDPVSFSRSARFRKTLRQNSQYLRNVNDANAWTNMSSTGTEQLYEYAMKAVEHGIEAVDGKTTGDVRDVLIESIRGLLQESVSQANSQYMGKSIFAGTLTHEGEPFVLTGDVVTYQGNDESIERRVSQTQTEQINITGQQIMDSGYFDALTALIGALEIDDLDEARNQIENLRSAENVILGLSSNLASTRSSLEMIENRLNKDNLNLTKYISENEDASLEEEYVRFNAEQITYQAALQSASEIMNMSIMDYWSVT